MKAKHIAVVLAALLMLGTAGAAAETPSMEMPETVYMECTYSGTDIPEQTMQIYYRLPDVRVEMTAFGVENIVIYNAAAGETYTYTVGTPMGMRGIFDADEDIDLGMPMDIGQAALASDGNSSVTTTQLPNGDEAIYMETTDGSTTQKMWFHPEYAIMLRIETYEGDQLLMTFETTSYEINPSLDDSLFEPPEDMQFVDLDLSDYTEMTP
jgi:hypothetical protein